MNFGMVIVALMLVGGSILGIFAIAQANQVPYTDTFGNTTSPITNSTHGIIENATAPAMGAAGGIALLFAATLVFIAAVFIARSVTKQNAYSSYRGR